MHTQKNSRRRDTFLFPPNIVGYLRALLLFCAIFSNKKWFCIFYTASYILDALDGYLARSMGQESQLGYVLDMSLDRASSTILSLYITKTYPYLFFLMATVVILDIISHFFCVAASILTKQSHKSHTKTSLPYTGSILSFYYSRAVLFFVCLGTEAFMLSFLCKKGWVLFSMAFFPFFLFKQVTNIAQFIEAINTLRFI